MATINELKWASMTTTVNEIKSPNQFLKKLLFGASEAKPTEDIEIDVISKGREAAPFVKKNGSGVMVLGHDETFQTVSGPNIRIKRPLTPSELLFSRRPGTVIFQQDAGGIVTAIQAHVARDLAGLSDLATNAEEYLCSKAVVGQISYQTADGDVFQITYPKPAENNITLSIFWDDVDPEAPTPEQDFHLVKETINEAVGLGATDAIMGATAAHYFMTLMKQQFKTGGLQPPGMNFGNVSFVSQFDMDGVIFLGTFCGIRCWQYSRTVKVNGVATKLIRDKYVEFVCADPAAENIMYYAAIPDMKALQGKLFQGQRFSKSWEEEDPSAFMALLHTRPLPVPRRPGSMVSLKVISGA